MKQFFFNEEGSLNVSQSVKSHPSYKRIMEDKYVTSEELGQQYQHIKAIFRKMEDSFTDEQKQMLEALKTRPITPDEDCPELTDEQLNKLAELAQQRREERNKQTVTLRLSPQALRTARSLGKGYTSVLSRILEGALADGEIIKHYL